MLNLIINKDILDNRLKDGNLRYIKSPYDRFSSVVLYENGISEGLKHIISNIENCEVNEAGDIKSKFTGRFIGQDKISDGCKTAAYVYYRTKVLNKDEIINITDCGPNAIEYIIKEYSEYDIVLYLGHLEIPINLECRIKINNDEEPIVNTDQIFQ